MSGNESKIVDYTNGEPNLPTCCEKMIPKFSFLAITGIKRGIFSRKIVMGEKTLYQCVACFRIEVVPSAFKGKITV